jgi:hypothetical protein
MATNIVHPPRIRIHDVLPCMPVSALTTGIQIPRCSLVSSAITATTEAGISGSREKRPELDRLMADAHRRRFDVVVCWKLDRLARSAKAGPGCR